MAAPLISNPEASLDSGRKNKRLKIEDDRNPAANTQVRWRSDKEQRIYSTKLVEALRQVQVRQGSSSSSPAGGRSVKEAADRVLAVAAKGATRWSRAILTSRLRLSKRLQKRRKARVTGDNRSKTTDVCRDRRRVPAVQRKVKVLSRLVPGCRKAPLPNLLEETSDYIAALEMQVRAMTALTQLLSGVPAPS